MQVFFVLKSQYRTTLDYTKTSNCSLSSPHEPQAMLRKRKNYPWIFGYTSQGILGIQNFKIRPLRDFENKHFFLTYRDEKTTLEWSKLVSPTYKMVFNCSSQFSVPKWKTMGSLSGILFCEILDVRKILVSWTTFFCLALKFGRNS